ncbi:MAG: hypothetical protein OXC60_17240 [Litoreibacter sp.]|nr:hypothetical protein [Litoreibacter sp.]
MLTNQLIGAAQNAVSHTPRPSAPQAQAVQAAMPFAAANSETKTLTNRPVAAAEESKDTRADMKDDGPRLEVPKRAELEVPKRVEMRLLLVDTVPDAVPESIYEAKKTDEVGPPESEPAE